MNKKSKILLLIAILFFIFIGGSIVYIFNPNERSHYRIHEENGEYYYKNYFSSKKNWLAYNDDVALISEYKTVWGRTYTINIWKYIDRNGRVVLKPDVYIADAFSEGLAAIIPREGDYWGYMDKTGNIVVKSKYLQASMFKNGLASVFVEDNGGEWILINKNGDCIQKLDKPLNWESYTQADPLS